MTLSPEIQHVLSFGSSRPPDYTLSVEKVRVKGPPYPGLRAASVVGRAVGSRFADRLPVVM